MVDNPGSKHQLAFTPHTGETVDATTESFIYQVRLPEALVSRLDFADGKEGLLAWVNGIVTRQSATGRDLVSANDGEEDKTTEVETNTEKVVVPALLPVPDEDIKGHPAVSLKTWYHDSYLFCSRPSLRFNGV